MKKHNISVLIIIILSMVSFLLIGNYMFIQQTLGSQMTEINQLNKNLENTLIEREDAYYLGLVRGCDIGCIDADLRTHNISWDDNSYSVLNSTDYRACSNVCVKKYGTKNE